MEESNKKYFNNFAIATVLLLAMLVDALLFHPKNSTGDELSVSAVIIPHHNIVATQRAKLFADLKNKLGSNENPTIILVSPNHYNVGAGNIQTTNHTWQLNKGFIKANTDIIKKISVNGLVKNEPSSFINEHGIYNILDDVENTFPHSTIVPIILKSTSINQLAKLESVLNQNCNRCLMIASVDFSHYQPALLAELHDKKTIRDLQTLDTEDLNLNVEVDSGSSLSLLTMWATDHKANKFVLKDHTNSSLLLNNPNIQGTSHIFGWYEFGVPTHPNKFITFVYSPIKEVGIENRSIWGTDMTLRRPITDQNNMENLLIAGTLTESNLSFFIVPIEKDTNKVIENNDQKSSIESTVYEKFNKYLQKNASGSYISIPITDTLKIDDLSLPALEAKIKSTINLVQ